MGIFNRGKKKPNPRAITKDPNPDQTVLRRLKAKQAKLASEEVTRLLSEGGPEIKARLASQILGIDIPVIEPMAPEDRVIEEELISDPDFREQVKAAKLAQLQGEIPEPSVADDIKRRVDEATIDYLEKHPEALAEAVTENLKSVVGASRKDGGLKDLVKQMRELRELSDELGGEKSSSWSDLLKDPALITEILKLIPALAATMPPGQQQLPPGQHPLLPPRPVQPKFVIADQDGNIREVDAEEFRQYTLSKKKERFEQQAQPIVATQSPNMPDEEEKQPEPDTSSVSSIQKFVPLLDDDPQVVVDNLCASSASGDQSSTEILNILQNNSAEKIVGYAKTLMNVPQYKEVATAISNKYDWIVMAQEYYKSLLDSNAEYDADEEIAHATG